MNEPLRIPQLTDEQREQLQASVNTSLGAIVAMLRAVAEATANAAKGMASVQEAFALAPPPLDGNDRPARCEHCGATSQCPLHAKEPTT